jgi:Domain of unknown function (DUF1707)/Domain of unknown function (DUF4190)
MTLEPEYGAAAGGYGYGTGQLRASTADRERAIDVLKAAFAEGRLTKEEYDERTGKVFGSRTYAELGALTSDLPVGPLGTLPVPPSPSAGPAAYHGPVYPMLPPHRPVNGLAVVSLICAFIPGVPSGIAVITGLAARRQIRETGQRGLGMATAAVAVGSLSVAFFLIYVLHIALGS